MSPRERAAIVQSVITGALTVREVCERHELSTQCVVGWVTEFRRASLEAFDARLRETLESQGIAAPLDVAAPHFVAARGELALPDLIQIMALGRRSGVITVAHDGTESRLWCADGEVIDAESGKLQGLAAVYRVLAVEHGRISTSFSADVDRPTRVRSATMELLLEGARRADECNVAKRALGAGCYRLASEPSANRSPGHEPLRDGDLSAAERALLNAFATPTTVDEALALSTLGDLEALTLIRSWLSNAWLVADAGLERPRAQPELSSTRAPQALSVPSGALALRGRRSPTLHALTLGATAGLGLGLAVWWSLPARTAAPGGEHPPVVALPALAPAATGANAPPSRAAAPGESAPAEKAPAETEPAETAPTDTVPAEVAPADRASPAGAPEETASLAEAPSRARPRAALPASSSDAARAQGSGGTLASAGPARLESSAAPPGAAPARTPQRASVRPLRRSASSERAPSAVSARAALTVADGAAAASAPEAPHEVPRMRIIEEQSPRMRVLE